VTALWIGVGRPLLADQRHAAGRSMLSKSAHVVAISSASGASYCAPLNATPLGDYYVQLHALTHIGVYGGAAANPTYFGSDLVHPRPLGYSELYPASVTPITNAIAAA
jgi:hypothetical protein